MMLVFLPEEHLGLRDVHGPPGDVAHVSPDDDADLAVMQRPFAGEPLPRHDRPPPTFDDRRVDDGSRGGGGGPPSRGGGRRGCCRRLGRPPPFFHSQRVPYHT